MIKGVVFDMDGLMFDTERLSAEGWAYAGKQLGIAVPRDLTLKTLGLTAQDTKRVYMDCFGPDFDFSAARAFRLAYVSDYISTNGMPLKPGLVELLDFLKKTGCKTAVATSTDREKTFYNLRRAGISDRFDTVVTGDMILRGKPEPDIYLKACSLLALAPEDCLALEDSPNGIRSAYSAGLKAVMIPDLVEPDAEVTALAYAKLPSLAEVIHLFKSMTND